MMSIEASLAANRRTSCSRWASASVGSVEIEIEYRPLEAAEHFCARCACAPLSGLMYQVRALALVPLPQAVSSPAAMSKTVPAALERRRRDLLVSTARSAPVSYTHLRAHETPEHLVCRLLLEKKKPKTTANN